MKTIECIILLFFILFIGNSKAQTYSQPAEVISAGGGESSGGNYSNFGVIGETFVDFSVTGGNYNTSIGFLYASNANTSIQEPDYVSSLSIYPNPNSGRFVLEMELTKPQEMKIEMVNVIGQVVYSEWLGKVSGSYRKELNLQKLAKGVYTLQLKTAEGTVNREVMLR